MYTHSRAVLANNIARIDASTTANEYVNSFYACKKPSFWSGRDASAITACVSFSSSLTFCAAGRSGQFGMAPGMVLNDMPFAHDHSRRVRMLLYLAAEHIKLCLDFVQTQRFKNAFKRA
jgi:hypothetical protein